MCIHYFSAHVVILIGHHAFAILATDAENDPLTYRLTGPNANFFSVDSNTGEVKVLVELDREVKCFCLFACFPDTSFLLILLRKCGKKYKTQKLNILITLHCYQPCFVFH